MIKFTVMDGNPVPMNYRGPIQACTADGTTLAQTFAPELDGTELQWDIRSGLANCPREHEPNVVYADPTKYEDWDVVVNEFMDEQTRTMLQRMLATAYVAMAAVEEALMGVAL